jgi:hypothetical protein
LAENALDARKLGFVFALYLYHANANKYYKQLQNDDEVHYKFHAFVERRRNNYPFAVCF